VIEIKTVLKKDIPHLLNTEAIWNMEFLVSSKHRLIAHYHNPNLEDEDIVLQLGYLNNELLGYIGVFTDYINCKDASEKVGWLSTWWVHPKSKGSGLGRALLDKMYQDFEGKIGISQFTPSAKRVYDKSGYFNDFKLSEGFKFAIRSNLKNVLPLINPRLKKYNFNGLDYIINIWFNFYHTFSKKNLRKKIPKDISVEYLSEIDSETSSFIKKNQENDIFRKSSDFFNWIKKYPWILPAPLHQFSKKEQYEFSMFSEEKFDYSFLKITQNNKIIGFTVLQQRDYSGKVLFSYFDKKNSKVISDIILLHFLNTKVRDFICYERLICDYLKTKKFLFIYKNRKVKHAIISKSFDLTEIEHLRFQYGDGDCAFA